MKLLLTAALGAAIFTCGAAGAQDYPDRPVTIIVPYAAGGIADIAARTIADSLSRKWGQEVLVDNRTGGAGFVAATAVTSAEPDGYTLFVADAGVMAINPYLFDSIPYDPVEDFVPITMISDTPLVLVANANEPYNTPAEYVEYAKANPGTLIFGSAGIGSVNHIVPEWINSVAGLDTQHVPYRGGAPAATAIASGEANVGVLALSSVGPFVDSGGLKILGLAREERVESHPEVPTLIESGVGDVAAGQWAGLFAPTGVPQEIIDKISQDTLEFLRSDEARATFAERGAIVSPMEPEAFRAELDALRETFSSIISEAGISAN